jgi:hypothetical protein
MVIKITRPNRAWQSVSSTSCIRQQTAALALYFVRTPPCIECFTMRHSFVLVKQWWFGSCRAMACVKRRVKYSLPALPFGQRNSAAPPLFQIGPAAHQFPGAPALRRGICKPPAVVVRRQPEANSRVADPIKKGPEVGPFVKTQNSTSSSSSSSGSAWAPATHSCMGAQLMMVWQYLAQAGSSGTS